MAKKQGILASAQDIADLRWDDVRLFLVALRGGTLGVASVKLGVDVSTMSRRLTALEEALGTRLFDRTRQGLVPTRAAELVLPAAEAMEAALARLTRDVSGLEAAAEGVVRVSVPPGMADAFVAPALPLLRAKYPLIKIELDASVRVLDLSRHEADLALRSVRPAGADLVVTKLSTSPWVVMTSPERAREKLRAWTDAPWIAWDADLASMAPARWLTKHVPRADIALRTSHFASQLRAAEAGLGLVLVPEPYARVCALSAARLGESLLPSAEELPTDDLWLVGHRALREVPRIAAVWSFLVETFREGKAAGRSRVAPA
ncbi:MAG: LysR family transcriptional regulator [Polyangiaceae bacterium]|nr:LysR family transcriptional regulator [Polyangiaceae bacterium]